MNDIEKAIENLKETLKMQKSALGGLPTKYQPIAKINDDIKATELAIQALEKQLNNGWILCSERMPEDDRSINTYVTIKHKETGYISSAKMLWFYGKFEWFNGRKISDKYEVIAWKYELMPEPYREESK